MAVSMQMIVGRIGAMLGNLIFPILLAYGCAAPIINLACFTLRKCYFFNQMLSSGCKIKRIMVPNNFKNYIIALIYF